MDTFVCIHGHFYQPPRENPWLETIEIQDDAAPYHDWNERITAECYGPNARARILNEAGKIRRIVNNYARISFNFGPTLLSWLENAAPDIYEAILEADRESQRRFSGHGSALAQGYNHVILPLSRPRDKRTQVLWGIADFERRFRRWPQGMWLPETAVDLETLDVMAAQGLRFTVLAPHQARRVRPLEGGAWSMAGGGQIDTSRAYRVDLPSGRKIAAFFYADDLAREVAFGTLLASGEQFGQRLLRAPARPGPCLVHIATDGETYGHHHRFGEMALAYALDYVEASGRARLTNYGEFLERAPPEWEVEIAENTSWSCHHGVERWRSDCGCTAGRHPGFRQAWRTPLRETLDWLRDRLEPVYEKEAGAIFADPWRARDRYADVVLDRSPTTIARFLREQAGTDLSHDEHVRALRLLEMERNAQLMFTSCGWFFEDLAGIETVQVLKYADRALQLAQQVVGDHLEAEFTARLAGASSNRPDEGDGARVYGTYVQPARTDLARVAAHYAVTALFDAGESTSIAPGYSVEREDLRLSDAGRTRLAVGRALVRSNSTLESSRLCFAAVHFGDHNIAAGVRPFESLERCQELGRVVSAAFASSDLPQVVRTIDSLYPEAFSLRSLFRDEQRRLIRMVLDPALEQAETLYRTLYEEHIPLLRFLTSIGYPLPNRFRAAAEFVLNIELRRVLGADRPDRDHAMALLHEARLAGIEADREGVAFVLQHTIERLAERFRERPGDLAACLALLQAVELAQDSVLPVNLWRTQNVFYDVLHGPQPDIQRRMDPEAARDWLEMLVDLGGALDVSVTTSSGPV